MPAQNPTCMNTRIRSTLDAEKIFMATKNGTLQMVTRRLDAEERAALRSGCCYAWEERGGQVTEIGIERFTEGRRWSPSRVRDSFLFYYEKWTPDTDTSNSASTASKQPPRDWDQLVKQTYSVWIDTPQGRKKWHLTAYFTQSTVDELGTIDNLPGVSELEVPEGLFHSTRSTKRKRPDDVLEGEKPSASAAVTRRSPGSPRTRSRAGSRTFTSFSAAVGSRPPPEIFPAAPAVAATLVPAVQPSPAPSQQNQNTTYPAQPVASNANYPATTVTSGLPAPATVPVNSYYPPQYQRQQQPQANYDVNAYPYTHANPTNAQYAPTVIDTRFPPNYHSQPAPPPDGSYSYAYPQGYAPGYYPQQVPQPAHHPHPQQGHPQQPANQRPVHQQAPLQQVHGQQPVYAQPSHSYAQYPQVQPPPYSQSNFQQNYSNPPSAPQQQQPQIYSGNSNPTHYPNAVPSQYANNQPSFPTNNHTQQHPPQYRYPSSDDGAYPLKPGLYQQPTPHVPLSQPQMQYQPQYSNTHSNSNTNHNSDGVITSNPIRQRGGQSASPTDISSRASPQPSSDDTKVSSSSSFVNRRNSSLSTTSSSGRPSSEVPQSPYQHPYGSSRMRSMGYDSTTNTTTPSYGSVSPMLPPFSVRQDSSSSRRMSAAQNQTPGTSLEFEGRSHQQQVHQRAKQGLNINISLDTHTHVSLQDLQRQVYPYKRDPGDDQALRTLKTS